MKRQYWLAVDGVVAVFTLLILAYPDSVGLLSNIVVRIPARAPRTTIESDEDAQCLLQNHPELAQKVGGDIAAAKKYYADKGLMEGMSGACPQTDEDVDMYINMYEDLKSEIGNDRNKGREHWRKYGWRQGRFGHARHKILMGPDSIARAQQDAHKPYKESMLLDPADEIRKKMAEAEAKAAKAASALNKEVSLKSVVTGFMCATDAQGHIVCHAHTDKPEPFQLEQVDTNKFVLRSNRTNRYCRDAEGDKRVVCDVVSPTNASEFTYLPVPAAIAANRFKMRSGRGLTCDHDDHGVVCSFPHEAAVVDAANGFEHGVMSATIEAGSIKAKVNHLVKDLIQPKIKKQEYGERAYGKEEEDPETTEGSSLSAVAWMSLAVAATVGVGVSTTLFKRWLVKRK